MRPWARFVLFSTLALVASCAKSKGGIDAGTPAPGASPPDSAQAAESVPSASSSEAKAAPAETATATPMIALVPKPIDTVGDGASKTAIRRVKMDDAELVRLVGSLPPLLALVGPEVRFYTSADAAEVARKAKERERDPVAGVVFSASPVLWNPEGTQEYLVLSGRSKHSTFVAALKLLPPSSYELASYFVFQKELLPVVLAYKNGTRRELFWTSCWGCPGDQGGVSVRDDHHVVIVQH